MQASHDTTRKQWLELLQQRTIVATDRHLIKGKRASSIARCLMLGLFSHCFQSFASLFRGAAKRSTDNDSQRDQLLMDLAIAVATRPFDEELFETACTAVEDSLGSGALMEAIGVAAGMDAATRCVDISGKEALPSFMLAIVGFVLKAINWLLSFF